MEILVIEDDPVIGKSVQQGIKEAGHGCNWVKDGPRLQPGDEPAL